MGGPAPAPTYGRLPAHSPSTVRERGREGGLPAHSPSTLRERGREGGLPAHSPSTVRERGREGGDGFVVDYSWCGSRGYTSLSVAILTPVTPPLERRTSIGSSGNLPEK